MNDVDPAWAWAPYKPDDRRPWNLSRAGHLFRRAAFGAGMPRLKQAVAEGPQRSVDRLFRPEADMAAFDGRPKKVSPSQPARKKMPARATSR